MRSLRIGIVGLCVLACGGKSLSPAAARIKEGSDSDLTDCSFLQKVQGTASDGDSNAQTSRRMVRMALVLLAIVTRLLTALDCGTQISVVTSMFLRGE